MISLYCRMLCYSRIFSSLDKYSDQIIELGSRVKLEFTIKCGELDFYRIDVPSKTKEIIEYITGRITNVYNTHHKRIKLSVDLKILPGCVEFHFHIDLEVLERMSMERFKLILGTVAACFVIAIVPPVMNNMTNFKIQEMNLKTQESNNRYELEKQRENHKFLMEVFEKYNLSGKDIVSLINKKEDEILDRSYELLQNNPITESVDKIQIEQESPHQDDEQESFHPSM